jgi:very-short-patch-repair endonuclease
MADDVAIARIAATQNRVLTARQLADAGFSWNAIVHRLDTARLQRLWHGVYLLGPAAPGPLSLAQAALLTVGDGFISRDWGAYLWRIRPLPELPVSVTITSGSHRGRKEVRVHRTVLTDPRDFTTRLGLPVTSPARTLLDIAPRLTAYALETAIAEAQVQKVVTEKGLRDVLARSGRHPGVGNLAAALHAGPGLTRSQYERILRRLLRGANLPQPRTNYRIGKWEVDFYWPGTGLIVEVDPYSTHGHSRAFEKDRRKAAELTAMGYRVMAFTDTQLTEEPLYVAATIARALAQSSSSTAGEFALRTSDSMPLAGSGREK